MNGPIAQLVALACHANARLRGRPADRFFPGNSTCRFCDSIAFVRAKRGLLGRGAGETPLAADPDEWFTLLATERRRAVRLHHTTLNEHGFSDRLTSAFVGGGGRWRLEVEGSAGADVYGAIWNVWNQDAPERRIWRVCYGLVATTRSSSARAADDLGALKVEMAGALRAIEDFARRRNLGGFADRFTNGLTCLDFDDTLALVHHKDLAPPGLLSRDAARLLAASQAAWVFGGMGSWNDLGFDGAEQQAYEAVSDRLFAIVTRAICAATNSTGAW